VPAPFSVDIRPDTFNLDETQIEKHVTSRTKGNYDGAFMLV